MSLGLVAYGSSDESEDEGNYETSEPSVSAVILKSEPPKTSRTSNDNNVDNSDTIPLIHNQTLKTIKNSEKLSNFETTLRADDEDEHVESQSANISNLKAVKTKTLSSLPAPKTSQLHNIDFDWSRLSAKHSTQPIKISVPSLAELCDDDDEPARKKLKASTTGSGLFALLPSPKNCVTSNAKSTLRPPQVNRTKVSTVGPNKSSIASKAAAVKHGNLLMKHKAPLPIDNDDSPDENDGNDGVEKVDFFSLTSTPSVPDPEIHIPDDLVLVGGKTTTDNKLQHTNDNLWTKNQPDVTHNVVSAVNMLPASSTLTETTNIDAHTSGPSYIPFQQDEDDNLKLDQAALQQLCGRRERHLGGADVQVIDINGDAILPDAREWMTKQLTEEQNVNVHSHNRKDGPTTQQRRKHQITYLAFQAKEHELELKNQWANNRVSRKQTQAKYGF